MCSRNEAPEICSLFRRGDSPLTKHYRLLHVTSADFSYVILFHTLCLFCNIVYTYVYYDLHTLRILMIVDDLVRKNCELRLRPSLC